MELGGLTNLKSLWLTNNQFTGEIPAELGGLANLVTLVLRSNQLSGEIPEELGDLANLVTLVLRSNQLSGEIPEELGGLTKLRRLDLQFNQFTGEIPAELGNLTNLEKLLLNYNQFTGEIPVELGGLINLELLWLNNNQFTGEIPAELGGLRKLERLSLERNMLAGEIPAELGGLADLRELNLRHNQLTGEIPEELGHLVYLETLWLEGNPFTGCLPRALRRVKSNDLHFLALPFCDVLLSGLTISLKPLYPSFDPYHTAYTTAVGQSRVTVAPASDHNTSFLFLDENDEAVRDLDEVLEGHQVDFSADLPTIKIRVVSDDSLASHTYTISDLGIRYDTNENGVIDREEAVAAIVDYFDDRILKGRDDCGHRGSTSPIRPQAQRHPLPVGDQDMTISPTACPALYLTKEPVSGSIGATPAGLGGWGSFCAPATFIRLADDIGGNYDQQ